VQLTSVKGRSRNFGGGVERGDANELGGRGGLETSKTEYNVFFLPHSPQDGAVSGRLVTTAPAHRYHTRRLLIPLYHDATADASAAASGTVTHDAPRRQAQERRLRRGRRIDRGGAARRGQITPGIPRDRNDSL
jgi:hypothetical protein